MTRNVLTGIFILALAGFGGCLLDDRGPDNLVSEEVYIDLLIELQLLKSYQESLPPDSVDIHSLRSEIFDTYGVTESQFTASHNFYQKQIDQQKQRVARAIDSLRMEIGKNGGGIDSLQLDRSQ